MEKNIVIKCDEYNIPGVLTVPDAKQEKYPCVLMLHGDLAYKQGDGFLLERLANKFANENIASLRIDYCSCGENRRNRKLYGLVTVKQEVKEAINYLRSLDFIDSKMIGLLGHSMGGKLAINCNEYNPNFVITLGGYLTTLNKNINPQYIGEDKDGNKFLMVYSSDKRNEVLYESYYKQEIEFNKTAKGEVTCPILICVGKTDFTVDQAISVKYFNNLNNNNKELLYIEDANHTFNAKTGDYTKVYELADKISAWINNLQ